MAMIYHCDQCGSDDTCILENSMYVLETFCGACGFTHKYDNSGINQANWPKEHTYVPD